MKSTGCSAPRAVERVINTTYGQAAQRFHLYVLFKFNRKSRPVVMTALYRSGAVDKYQSSAWRHLK